MTVGPSEVLVYIDETAKPGFVTADLLSQAEHGIDSFQKKIAVQEISQKGLQRLGIVIETMAEAE